MRLPGVFATAVVVAEAEADAARQPAPAWPQTAAPGPRVPAHLGPTRCQTRPFDPNVGSGPTAQYSILYRYYRAKVANMTFRFDITNPQAVAAHLPDLR